MKSLPSQSLPIVSRRSALAAIAASAAGVAAVTLTRAQEPSMAQKPSTAAHNDLTAIHYEIDFAAPPARFYQAITDQKQFASFSGLPPPSTPIPAAHSPCLAASSLAETSNSSPTSASYRPGVPLTGTLASIPSSASKSNLEAAIEQALRELAEFFPAVREANLIKAALVKEVRATFGVPPGIDAARPGAVSPWPGLFLAGDWVRTGWPSTMESAARSGHLAAEALCRTAGHAQTFIVPDLKPRGLMRLVGV